MAHLGNTVVNGALRVIGGEYVDTINGVTVGSSPKFTDTTYNFAGSMFRSGNQNNQEHNANNCTDNGNYYYSSNGPSTDIGASTADGALYVQSYSSSWVAQMAQDYRNGNLFVRGKNNGTWQAWKQVAYKSDISTLQSNFQAGVDSVYNAIVARGTTPASKSLSDVVTAIGNIQTTHTTVYTPTARASRNDMGQTHSYRYVDTTSVPNTNSGTYTPAGNAIYDMGATNTNRYCDGRTAFAAGKADHSATYTPTARASNNDMGQTHSYRYVNTNSVPNSNSGTYTLTVTSQNNGLKDMGATNTYRYVNLTASNYNSGTYTFPANDTGGTKDMGEANTNRYVNASNVYTKGKVDGKADHTATYKPTARATANDMGQTHSYRYVDTTAVPNSNSGTYTPAGNAIYDMGATNTNRYCDGRTAYTAGYNAKKATLTGTYKPTSRATALDMGADHGYRYVNTTSVPNTNSGTYTFPVNDLGDLKDLGASNTYRYVDASNVYIKGKSDGYTVHDGVYTPTARASRNDMGESHTYRYVDTRSVPNSNSGTATYTSNGTHDMGSTNSYRYVTVNVANSNSGTASYDSNGLKDMGATNSYRYVNINVANSNSATYTFAANDTGGTKDLGATNNYRYVNASNVYSKGNTDGYNSGYAAGTAAGYTSGYGAGTADGYNSGYNAGYNKGVSDADARVNTSSASYTSGYNAGTAAGYSSGYSAGTSAGYSSGYNQGVTDADARVNTSSASYTSGYNAGYAAAPGDIKHTVQVGTSDPDDFKVWVDGNLVAWVQCPGNYTISWQGSI